jgi:dTDP-4-amino-4,6-dideoxygalactose transaminase
MAFELKKGYRIADVRPEAEVNDGAMPPGEENDTIQNPPHFIPGVRKSFLPFALPDIGEEEFAEIRKVLDSGWITTGPKVSQFETEFAKAVGARYAIAVNSCTAALHLALDAIGLKTGDEVITTPYTFAATSEVIRYFDARPVFVDVEPDTLNIDPRQIQAKITKRTKAFLPVHIAGLPANLSWLHEIARAHNLPVVEDAAHAFPAKYNHAMIGGLSHFTCFSFYATKTITTGEGGMLCTNSETQARHCRQMSLHGISKDAWKRYTNEGSWYYEIAAPGFKYNMTDMAAAMGLVQLRKANAMRRRRAEIAARYNRMFGPLLELQIPPDSLNCLHSWHLYMLRLNLDRLRIDRREFIENLQRRKIKASVHFIPLHVHPFYRDKFGFKPDDYPIAYREYMREVSLPIYSRMTDEDVQSVIDAVLQIVDSSRI